MRIAPNGHTFPAYNTMKILDNEGFVRSCLQNRRNNLAAWLTADNLSLLFVKTEICFYNFLTVNDVSRLLKIY